MKKSLTFILLPFLLAAAPHAHAANQKACLLRSIMIDTLITEYGEQLAEVREIKGKGLLEFHVSPNDGSWTAVLTNDDGISCVLAVGEGIDPSKTITTETGQQI